MTPPSPEVQGMGTDPSMTARLLEAIAKVSAVINLKNLGFASRVDQILRIILDYLGVEQGSIMILEKRRKLVVWAATRQELVGLTQSVDDDTISAFVARTGEPQFIRDISGDPRFKQRQSGGSYKTKALLSAPIKRQDTVVGVINVTDKAGNKDLLQEDIAYLLNFSSVVLSLVLQKKMHDEIRKRKNSLKKKNQELIHRESLQNELSRMLIHDLKGPLSEAIANLDILSYTIPPEQREFVELAQMACDRAVRMASNLGSVAQIEDGKLKPLRQEVDAAKLIEESVVALTGLAKIKDVAIMAEPLLPMVPTIYIDRVLILRVLQNLLTNAIGYSPSGTTITVGCNRPVRKNALNFHVQDQGAGLTPEEQASIFNKYARISTKQDNLVGTGLGLYFCKLAVEVHKGRIWVESEPGKGCRFCFSLPY